MIVLCVSLSGALLGRLPLLVCGDAEIALSQCVRHSAFNGSRVRGPGHSAFNGSRQLAYGSLPLLE